MAEAQDGVLDLSYDAAPTVRRFMDDDSMVRGIMGPVGSGKSSGSIMEIVKRAAQTPPCADGIRHSRCCVIRNTYPELRDTTIRTFKEWVPENVLGHWNVSELVFIISFHDGEHEVRCEVLFRALDRPDDVAKLKSLELTFAYINECSEIDHSVFKLLLTRIGRYPAAKNLPDTVRAWSGLWFDTNPPDTDHWLYRLFEEQRPPKHVLYKQPSGLSPEAENIFHPVTGKRVLKEGYYEDIAASQVDDPEFVKVFVHGEYGFPRTGKPIFPEWKDNLHVDASIVARPDLDLLVGMDFGLTPAAALAQRDPTDGQIQVFDEFVSDDMGAFTFGSELKRKLGIEYPNRAVIGWADPAGEQRAQTDERTPFDILNGIGLHLSPGPTNDFTIRREAVAMNLTRLTMKGRPGLVVHPKARTLRKAMQGAYCYARVQVRGDARYKDKPEKNSYSHIADGLQYLMTGLGEGRLPLTGGAPPRRVQLRIRHSF